jgi:hypothetical protein
MAQNCPHCGKGIEIKLSVPDNNLFSRMTIENVMPFGKYAGMTMEQILKENPSYIVYAAENFTNIAIEPSMLERARNLMASRRSYRDRKLAEADQRFDDSPDWGDEVPF